jgi:integral membrane protein (TIGR01906 family)
MKDAVPATIARLVLGVCTPLFLLLSNLYLVATPRYIQREYNSPGFPFANQYDDAERLSLAEATLYYMRSGEGAEYLTALQVRGHAVYNEREVQHLIDAKRVMQVAFGVHGACGVLILAATVFLWRRRELWPGALRAMSRGCILLFMLLFGIGFLAFVNFDLFFTAFHRLFFEGDTWLFPRSDTLIQLFPLPFWMDATFILALLTLAESLIVAAVAYVLSRRLSRTR